jgi:hypothetical protein
MDDNASPTRDTFIFDEVTVDHEFTPGLVHIARATGWTPQMELV